jgi:O-antigen ligase
MNSGPSYPSYRYRPYRFRGNTVQELVASYPVRVIFFILIHIPLAFAFRWNSTISTLHALGTFALGLWFLAHDKYPDRLIYVTAYITGAELLWRAMGASVFWEFGKYSVGLLLLLGLLKYRRMFRADKRPLIYFLLLLPSISLLSVFDREMIAFNLTGPFLLAVATMFFSTVQLTGDRMKRIFVALLAPIVGLGFMASYLTSLYAETIQFGMASIRETSAGYGPNQVASMLGLGTLVAFLYLFIDRRHWGLRLLILGSLVWLLAQATLTFSRGGVWTGIGAAAIGGFYLIRDRRLRGLSVLVIAVVFGVSYFFVFPALTEFTGDTLSARFRSLDTTGRESIIEDDLRAFAEHPVAGVGPGQSRKYHTFYFGRASAHTEYSRMLAEHGSLGILSMILLIWMAFGKFTMRIPPNRKAYSVAFVTWALLFMTHSAMRLAAPSFLFGLASATLLPEFETADRR